MLFHTPNENFFFDKYIFEARVVFDKVHVLCDVPIKNLGGCARRPVLLGVSVALTKTDVGWLFADGILCHLESIPNGDTIGEKVTALGLGDIPQGVVGGAVVETGVMGDDGLDIVFLA